ncbi:hypothetical protein F0562_027830 [Nyssa sinensis]|uniref:Chromo domain-containing protein n=1 Tax=Nyssa sinensis TaxID=561372 RepID=A0A5J5B9A6_9ASTE|nr:hypothetical protein F0562_027830 [Nyssa sinensis]
MDQRVENLEQTMQSLSTGQQELLNRMADMFEKLSTRMDNLANNTAREHGESSQAPNQTVGGQQHSNNGNGIGSSSSYVPRLVKLDFPRFNGGEDPTSWLCRAEQFFQFQETPEADRVSLASFHLEGDAQLWYQLQKQENSVLVWSDFKEGLLSRFGPNQFCDFFGELTKLQQSGTVQDYQTRFEKLLAKVGHLPQARQVSCFVSGLRDSIRADVQAELQDRRNKGLCYNCDEKFKPGHRCKKLFIIEACLDEDEGDLIMEEDCEDENQLVETLEISLHAINGVRSAETMRIQGSLRQVAVYALIDSGSTHNFVSEKLAKKVCLKPQLGGTLRVTVASGEQLESPASPLTKMLNKDSFKWNPIAEEAFEQLKKVMTGAPVLALPNFSKTFIVECDASGSGIGGVLRQDRPIAFYSYALKGKNLLLSTYEKEMLALVMAVQKWRAYLLGRQFVICTDQQSLKHLWHQKITTSAQQKWLYKLMGFDFVIIYKKGKKNIVADALSRQHEHDEGEALAISQPVPRWTIAIKEEVATNSDLQQLVKLISDGEALGPWKFQNGLLFFKEKIYLAKDSSLTEDIISQFHGSTHEGFMKSFHRIRSTFYWQVAYKLELPRESRIHPVFHVSLLKKQVGNHVTVQTQLPTTSSEKLMPHPQAILDQRKQGKEVLVHWQGLSPAEATWENLEFMKNQFPDFADISTWGQVLALRGRK